MCDNKYPSYWISPPFATFKEPINHQQIISCVCTFYGLKLEEIQRKCRYRKIVIGRQASWYLMKKLLPKSTLKEISQLFGNGFDHTTVIHSIQTVYNLMDTDIDFKNNIDRIEQIIKS